MIVISKADCIDGGWYRGVHRCGRLATWHARRAKFDVPSFSMGQHYFEEAAHCDDDFPGNRISCFIPFEEIDLSITVEESRLANRINYPITEVKP